MVEKGLPEEVLDSIEKNALLNATKHDGRADAGALMGKVLGEFPEMRSVAGEVNRQVRAIASRINSMSPAEQGSLLASKYPGSGQTIQKEGRVGLPPLPNAEKGKASFRLPPEPSGFMHIGHAMAFTVNYLYREMYDGELWLRFEDTNPKKASKRYYESFRRGLEWLGIKWDHEKAVSDDIELMYEYGRTLLEKGQAYSCACDLAKVKKMRFDGVPCEHRNHSVEENLAIWDSMLAKELGEGSYVVRLKGDMSSLDYSLRDPNIFRVILYEHPLTGSKYAVWPTYDFANTIEDELCGITHVLRSSEFHTALQDLIRETLSFRKVNVVQFSRYNFKGTPVAKRLLRPLVEKGLVSGWDDPRMPTVDGVRRRGLLPEAIRQFTLHVGYTKTEHEYDWSLLFSVNRKLLDPISRRYFFVPDPVKLKIEGAPRRTVTIPFHPEKDLGSRSFELGDELFVPRADLATLAKGTVFRLMDLYNLEMTGSGETPTAKFAGDGLIHDTRKLQWVLPVAAETKVMVTDVLFNEKGEFNPDSLKTVTGLSERSSTDLKPGEIVQFPRFGFCRLDEPGTFILGHR